MKVIKLILVCVMVCNCKSLSENVVNSVKYNAPSAMLKKDKKQSIKSQNTKLLKHDIYFYRIHDTIKKKQTNELTQMF